jgi:hypothetical protein
LSRRLALAVVTALVIFAVPAAICFGDPDVETRIKAAYIYNFARFVE